MMRIMLLGLAAATVVVAMVMTWPRATASAASAVAAERCGIDRLHLRLTAEGHMLDLRYRVVDPDRARSLLAKDATAYVIHERSGRRLPVPDTPKAGALRNHGTPKTGRTYFALFSNAGGVVERGDRVTVVLGELSATMVVE